MQATWCKPTHPFSSHTLLHTHTQCQPNHDHHSVFRLLGTPDTKGITCELVDGENVVFWEDIEQVFPGVTCIANGITVVSLMRD
jgi:hypothetical protein